MAKTRLKIYSSPCQTAEEAALDLAAALREVGDPPAKMAMQIVDGIRVDRDSESWAAERLILVNHDAEPIPGFRFLAIREPGSRAQDKYALKLTGYLIKLEFGRRRQSPSVTYLGR